MLQKGMDKFKTICKSVEFNKAKVAVQVFINDDDDYLGCL